MKTNSTKYAIRVSYYISRLREITGYNAVDLTPNPHHDRFGQAPEAQGIPIDLAR